MTELLTGNYRFRPKNRLFKSPLMVLQVEEQVMSDRYDYRFSTFDNEKYVHWRDAKVEDIVTGRLNFEVGFTNGK